MNPTIEALVAQAQQLSEDDRELLLIRLQQALAPPVDPAIEAAWIEEAERRLDAVERGEMKSTPWEDARKGLGLG